MTKNAPPLLFKSLTKIINTLSVCVLFLLVFFSYFHPINALRQDLGRHLLLGEIIAQTKHVPNTNLLSYTFPDSPFINSHWLFEVLSYQIQNTFGFNTLLLLSTIIGVLAFLLLFITANKHASLPAILVASLFYLPLLFERTDIRPELFSFFFLSLFITILYQYRTSFTRWIFLLIPLQLLWVNIHIYFFIGIGLTGIFLLERLLIERNKISTPTKTLIIICCSLLFVSLINPNGIHGLLFPLTVHNNYGFPVIENQSPFLLQSLFQQPSILFFKFALFFNGLLILLRIKQTKPLDWLLLSLFSIAGALAIRNIPLFVFCTFTIFCQSLTHIFSVSHSILKRYIQPLHQNILRTSLLTILLLFFVAMLGRLLTFQPIGFSIEEGEANAVKFFKQNNLSGPIYNNFDAGSYLAYKLYPHEKIFVDGRVEAYPKEFFNNIYLPMQKDPKRFEEINKQYNFNTVFISHYDQTPWPHPLLTYLFTKQKLFIPVYLDDYAVIFVKQNEKNKYVIQNNALSEKTFTVSSHLSVESQIRYLYLFEKLQWETQKKVLLEEMMNHKTSACQLHYKLSLLDQSTILQQKNEKQLQQMCR